MTQSRRAAGRVDRLVPVQAVAPAARLVRGQVAGRSRRSARSNRHLLLETLPPPGRAGHIKRAGEQAQRYNHRHPGLDPG